MLLEDNEADVVEAVGLALRYNITELQLSHSIIMDIDEINDDAARAERIRRYIDIIHSAYGPRARGAGAGGPGAGGQGTRRQWACSAQGGAAGVAVLIRWTRGRARLCVWA